MSNSTSNITASILRAIVYADIFNYALSQQELESRLLNFLPGEKPKKKVSQQEIATSINRLIQERKIVVLKDSLGQLYCLPGRKQLFAIRKNKALIQKEKIEQATKAANIFAVFPTVLAVFVSGSVAANNAASQDDIDFFMVTKKGCLWTTRLFVVFTTKLLGKYPRPDKKPSKQKNKWCLNTWVDETALGVNPNKRNFFTAHEIVLAKVLVDKAQIQQNLLKKNAWIYRFLPNARRPILKKERRSEKQGIGLRTVTEFLFGQVESLLFFLQKQYMKNKITREEVGRSVAYFHPHDMYKKIQKRILQYDSNILEE